MFAEKSLFNSSSRTKLKYKELNLRTKKINTNTEEKGLRVIAWHPKVTAPM